MPLSSPFRCWKPLSSLASVFFRSPAVAGLTARPPPPEEFVAKENINYHTDTTVREGDVCKDDKTLLASNLPPPSELAAHPDVTCRNALTFDPSPPLEEEDKYSVATPDDEAELMH